jgi:hypothetical protein
MDVTCDLLCWITTILACLKSLMISLDYRSYMGSSVRIWLLQWLFLYLCSYNLDGSVTLSHFSSSLALAPRPHRRLGGAQNPSRRHIFYTPAASPPPRHVPAMSSWEGPKTLVVIASFLISTQLAMLVEHIWTVGEVACYTATPRVLACWATTRSRRHKSMVSPGN